MNKFRQLRDAIANDSVGGKNHVTEFYDRAKVLFDFSSVLSETLVIQDNNVIFHTNINEEPPD